MQEVRCKCGTVLQKTPNCSSKDRQPCPKCGSLNRIYEEHLKEQVIPREGTGIKARHANSRKPFWESYHGPERSIKTGGMVLKERVIDRENNNYIEKVQSYETGEMLHNCEEPLTEHIGHGDAKKKER